MYIHTYTSHPELFFLHLPRKMEPIEGSETYIYIYIYIYTDASQPELFFLHLPRKMEPIEGSETSTFKPQTLGKYPKENILHNEHGESLKSRQPEVTYQLWCGRTRKTYAS